ncbi:3-hydroxyacyl-CoA dehydrogenase family protein [Bacillus marinisedimentorum]|uniref:3-hydroxyacyl-CoA dehydrogenase family protein n=1 Tax=Bacillus marinisedimentorum TaxID=1821260 RepID=UPI0007E11A78|nr:3-hydroxyacyl-CoA dehydrogenase family protein [Bacillus marinisedimentorum]
MEIREICVIGAGSMGHQISMLCALGGYETTLQDINERALKKAENQLQSIMEKWVAKGKILEDEMQSAFERLRFTTDLEQAAGDADFVIEAVVEKLEIKQEVFEKLDKIAPSDAILATNSSTIVNSLIAGVTSRPDKVINMHFFFPPLVMECVEVVVSEQTSEESAQTTLAVCEKINKTGVLIHKEISGFVANRILGAMQKEAMNLYDQGVADYKDIDLIVKKALGHKIGPFELMDLSGNDVVYFVMKQRFDETGDPADNPPHFIEEKVIAGELGRKTGKGWYEYGQAIIKN